MNGGSFLLQYPNVLLCYTMVYGNLACLISRRAYPNAQVWWGHYTKAHICNKPLEWFSRYVQLYTVSVMHWLSPASLIFINEIIMSANECSSSMARCRTSVTSWTRSWLYRMYPYVCTCIYIHSFVFGSFLFLFGRTIAHRANVICCTYTRCTRCIFSYIHRTFTYEWFHGMH